MGKFVKRNQSLTVPTTNAPDKIDTWAGKQTARVTKIYNQPDGSILKATRKINKDGSITDRLEHRHK